MSQPCEIMILYDSACNGDLELTTIHFANGITKNEIPKY